MPTIVIDMDGTLCDCEHRVHLAAAGQWDEFHSHLMEDNVMKDLEFLLSSLEDNVQVIACTGRNAAFYNATTRWLNDNNIFLDHVLMRPDGDFTPDHELKPRLLEEHFGSKEAVLEEVKFVIDDRDKVVEAWRNYGLPCWQCRPGGY